MRFNIKRDNMGRRPKFLTIEVIAIHEVLTMIASCRIAYR